MTVTLANAQALSNELIRYGPSTVTNHVNSFSPPSVEALDHLANQSKNILFTAYNIFPLDIFPDTISIDENKVNIIYRTFFGINTVHSILISDITDVTIDTFFFFASLNIIDSSNYRFPITLSINRLRIKDALEARRLIQGLIAAKRQGIELSTIEVADVRRRIVDVGSSRSGLR